MMEQFFHVIIDYIVLWGYAAIAIGMALESACIPVPSELVFGFAGYLVYLGQLDFAMAVVAGGLLYIIIGKITLSKGLAIGDKDSFGMDE